MIYKLYTFLKKSTGVFFVLLCFYTSQGQTLKPDPKKAEAKEAPRPENVKLISEYKDGKGNIVRTVRYDQGSQRITETLIIPINPVVNLHLPINPDTLNKDSVLLVVNKSKYNLEVFYNKKKIRSYKAVFGPRPLEDKCLEGDRCTPEGWYKIQSKIPQSKYDKFMLLDFPNDSAIAKFNKLKAKGAVSKTARMGGNLGIHGIWKGGDDMIEMSVGWTDGCIALKNKDIEELFTFVGVGTRVFIRK